MTCTDAERLIARMADGTALDLEAAPHVESCAACRAVLEEQATVQRLLSGMEMEPAPSDFVARVRERIESRASLLTMADWKSWTLRLAPVAVGLVLFAVGTVMRSDPAPLTLDRLLQYWTGGIGKPPVTDVFWGDVSNDALLVTLVEGEPDPSTVVDPEIPR